VEFVYRAIRNKNWVRNGIQEQAFFRRSPLHHAHPDLTGLSVDYTYQAAAGRFRLGAIKISVAKLSVIGLSVVPHGDHACIHEVPYDTPETRSEALKYANAIIKCCP
jgi:hypothetical protein